MKRVYKKLAFENHPDRNPGNSHAEDRFKEINEAYQILSSPQKRARYDSMSHLSGGGIFGDDINNNFNDIFENLFEQVFNVGKRRRPEKGRDLRYDLDLTFEEAARGVEKEIIIPKSAPCAECGGSGAAEGGEITCSGCGGTGAVRYSEGFFSMSRSCSRCSGLGTIIKDKCEKCGGRGATVSNHKVKVRVPAGVDTGIRLKIKREGDLGFFGAQSGDLYIKLDVKEHPFFKRQGQDVYCEVPVSFSQAALGDEITVPTLEGKDSISIPAGTQPGQTFKLGRRGVRGIDGGRRGDLYIRIQVEVPIKVSPKQRRLLEEFARSGEDSETPATNSFFEKLRELFG